MKKFRILPLILSLFILSLSVSCKPSVNPNPAKQNETSDTSSSTPAESSSSSSSSQSTLVTGTPVKDGTQKLTVTPRSDGLLIHLNFTDTDPWRHISFYVQENIPNEWHESIEAQVQIIEQNNKKSCELLFPFTVTGKSYKVWFSHMGNADDEWADWDKTEDDAAIVTSLGGLGKLDVTCLNDAVQYWSPRRGLYLKGLNVTKPALNSIQEKFKVRAEVGARWESTEKTFETPFTGDIIWFPEEGNIPPENGSDQDFINLIKGQTKIFLTVQYVLVYNNVEFAQRLYGNYPLWDDTSQSEIPNSNWFADYAALNSNATKLPVIKIQTTGDYADDYHFATDPVAAHINQDPNVPAPYYADCNITAIDEDGNVTSVENTKAQVKVRGNYTTCYEKKPFRIKFNKKQNLLGLHEGAKFKNWVLLASFKDASLLRDAAAFKLFKELFPDSGLYSSDAKLVEVFINDVYWGVYVLVEQQEAKDDDDGNPTRINVKEVPDGKAEPDIGYIIEFDAYSSSEPEDEQFTIDYTCGENKKLYDYYGTEVTNMNEGYTLKSDINSHDQKLFIQQYMNELWNICYKAAYDHQYYKIKDTYALEDDTFTEEYTDVQGSNDAEKCVDTVSKLIDIDSLVDSYIFNELVCDPDLHWSSFYMSIDFSEGAADKKLRFEAPWDFDSTMGNRPFNGPEMYSVNGGASEMYAGQAQPDIWQNDENAANGNPWLMLFIRSDWFKQLVKESQLLEKYEALYTGSPKYS